MKIGLLVVGIVAVGAFPTVALAKKVTNVALGFSAEFPVTPDTHVPSPAELAPYGAVRAVVHEASDDVAYSVTAVQMLPDGDRFADPMKALAFIRSQCIVSNNIIREAPFALPGGIGREAMSVRKDSGGINEIFDLVRFAVRGNKAYCARASAHGGGPEGTEAQRRFIKTFSISTK